MKPVSDFPLPKMCLKVKVDGARQRLLMLSFLGGGTRAAAFSCGVLQALHRAGSGPKSAKSLLDRVEFVSGAAPNALSRPR